MKIYLTFMILIGFCFLNAEPVSVISQNQDEIIVEFNLPEFEIREISEQNIVFDQIICPQAALSQEEGAPELPFFTAVIGLPVDGDYDLVILEQNKRIRTNLNIFPVRKLIDLGNETENIFFQDDQIYKLSHLYPESVVNKGETAYLGDRYFAGLRIYPFQYNPHEKQLLITSYLKIKVLIYGEKDISRSWSSSSNFIDKIGDDFFLNNDYSKYWRKEKFKSEYKPPTRSNDLVNEVQIIVDQEGIYKITRDFLEQALEEYRLEQEVEFEMEFDWSEIDPRNLELVDKFDTVPIHFVGEADGTFDEDDYFEFYGFPHHGETCYYDDFTSENVYVLKYMDHFGSRMAVEDGGLDLEEYYTPETYRYTAHFEEQSHYDRLGAQFDWSEEEENFFREDLWFWSKISAPDLEIFPFDIDYPYIGSSLYGFEAKVSLYGATYNPDDYFAINHHAVVRINSALINNLQWYGQREQIFQNSDFISNSDLVHGTNNLYISLPGIPNQINEQVMFDYLEITYWREYKTDDNTLKFTKPSNRPLGIYQFELENFSTDSVYVYKIGSSIMENIQAIPFTDMGDPPFKITFQDEIISEDIQYYAVSESMKKQPLMIKPNLPSDLKNPTNAADYIIITAQNMIADEGTLYLEQIWEEKGKTVELVNLQDIFDEFNYGIRNSQAIKDFISYAYNNWSSPDLTHVLLLGDGIYDERDSSVNREDNIVPIKKVWVQRLGAIASDNWYACIVGEDQVADISISRINIWEREQIMDIAEKTDNYLNNPNFDDLWHSRVTFAAGGKVSDGSLFAQQCESIKNAWVPEEYHVSRVYCNTAGMPSIFNGNTTSLITNINEGTIYLSFMGHGAGLVWGDYNLLNNSDVRTLNNNNYPFISSLSCFASAFDTPQSSCLGEELIIEPGKAAIAHVGFTGYGYLNADVPFGKHIVEGLFDKKIPTIGEVMSFTKAKIFAQYGTTTQGIALTQGCGLLGDAMNGFILPQEDKEVSLNQYNLVPGDTLKMESYVGPEIIRGKFVIYDENDAQLTLDDYYPFMLPAVNDTLRATDYVIEGNESTIYSRSVKIFAYGEDLEIKGINHFTVGQAAMVNLQISPEIPTAGDSIMISADFFDLQGIDNIVCIVNEIIEYPMQEIGENRYGLINAIEPQTVGETIEFYFIIQDLEGNDTVTLTNEILVSGVDLYIQYHEMTEENHLPGTRALIQNIGSFPSSECVLRLYEISDEEPILINSKTIDPLDILEARWEFLEIPLSNGEVQFEVIVNEDLESFDEYSLDNNSLAMDPMNLNMFFAGLEPCDATSLDNNLNCGFPAGLLSEETVFYIDDQGQKSPINQPDIQWLKLLDGNYSTSYQINTLNETLLADTLGHFPDEQRIKLTFYYDPADSLNQYYENSGDFFVYRWENRYQKWVYQGGEIFTEEDKVEYYADQVGVYTILFNQDNVIPTIDANVEGQEFAQGGYLSKKGIISFVLNDANGIDVFSNTIFMEVDGIIIQPEDYTITLSYGNLTHVPIKFDVSPLELSDGEHYLTLSCTDMNGRFNDIDINFIVTTDFDIIKIANYPNPVKTEVIDPLNAGRTFFTYILTDDADKVNLKIYTVSGRLVKSFRNLPNSVGYHEVPRTLLGWDCRDKQGVFLANGIYFYRFTGWKNGKKIEKTGKMAILK